MNPQSRLLRLLCSGRMRGGMLRRGFSVAKDSGLKGDSTVRSSLYELEDSLEGDGLREGLVDSVSLYEILDRVDESDLQQHSELFQELRSKGYKRKSSGSDVQEKSVVAIDPGLENYANIEYLDRQMTEQKRPDLRVGGYNEPIIGVSTLDGSISSMTQKENVRFKHLESKEVQLESIYLEDFLPMPNYKTLHKAEKRLLKLTGQVKNLQSRMSFFKLISLFRKIRTDFQIGKLVEKPRERLGPAHWRLKNQIDPFKDQIQLLLGQLIHKEEFVLAQELIYLIDDFGFDMAGFVKEIFKSAPIAARTKDYEGLYKTLEIAAEYIRREVDYSNILFQLLRQKDTTQRFDQINHSLAKSNKIFGDLEKMLEGTSKEKDFYEGLFNMTWARENESVGEIGRRNSDFEAKFRRRIWFNRPKALDFSVDLNEIEDESILLQLEFLYFLRERTSRIANDEYNALYSEETFLVNILMRYDRNSVWREGLAGVKAFDAFLRIKSYSAIKPKILSEFEKGSQSRHVQYTEFFSGILDAMYERGTLVQFVGENLYLVDLLLSKPDLFVFRGKTHRGLIESIFALDLGGFVYQDQKVAINLLYKCLPHSHLFGATEMLSLRKKIFVMLNVPNSTEFSEVAFNYSLSIASLFAKNPDILRMLLRYISKSLPSNFLGKKTAFIMENIKKLHLIFKLVEGLGLHDDISDFGLDKVRAYCDFDCLARQRGLDPMDLGESLKSFRVMKQRCHELASQERFGLLVEHEIGDLGLRTRLLDPKEIVNDSLGRYVREGLNGR